jgi:large conductance mechanosensitive channel
MISDFQAFLTKTNALALAIGVMIGAAVGNVISALAADVLMPVVSLFLPAGGWREARFVLSKATDASGKVTENAILYGHLLGTVIDFLIVSLVLFLIVRSLLRPAATPPAEGTKICGECLEVIPLAARRCRACTAAIAESPDFSVS